MPPALPFGLVGIVPLLYPNPSVEAAIRRRERWTRKDLTHSVLEGTARRLRLIHRAACVVTAGVLPILWVIMQAQRS
ncbi:MAG: hypothetical protein ACYCP0_04355 [Acidiferrobacteraceae bacterium]